MSGFRDWLRQWWPRLVAGLALAVVAVVTGRVSYTHIKALSLALHQPPGDAAIMPFGVDGLVIVGAIVLLTAAPGQQWLGWLGIGPGVAASLFANWESGISYGVKAAIWATVPAVAFALACFLFERWLAAQVKPVAHAGPGGSPEPEAEESSAGPEPRPEPVPWTPEPLTPETALRVLIGTGSRREIAALLKVPKTRVDRWAAEFRVTGDPVDQAAHDALEADAEAALDSLALGHLLNAEANGDGHRA